MIEVCEAALGGILDPQRDPIYEAPPRDLPDLPSIIRDLQLRVEKIEKAAFWRTLEENPPKDGAPILPSHDWLEEARQRFHDLYGPPTDAA